MVLQKENIATLLKLHVPCSYIPIHLLIVGVTFLLVIWLVECFFISEHQSPSLLLVSVEPLFKVSPWFNHVCLHWLLSVSEKTPSIHPLYVLADVTFFKDIIFFNSLVTKECLSGLLVPPLLFLLIWSYSHQIHQSLAYLWFLISLPINVILLLHQWRKLSLNRLMIHLHLSFRPFNFLWPNLNNIRTC